MKQNNITIKKIISLLSITAFVISSTFLTSCQDDAETYDPNSDVITDLDNGILNGTLTENYTLDANTTYQLTGAFVVNPGSELTIPAGTKIEAIKGGSNIFIAVFQGAKIFVNGTAEAPVTISTLDGEPGGWSGISIFGTAHSLGVQSVLAGFYGGDNEEDNSGSISYLNIIGTGNSLTTQENTNGLALFGVGSGTTINNIAIINGKDDGIEFYGGTVSITNLYLEDNLDDGIDWNEGWDGTITNAYIANNGSFSTALEGDFVQIDEENPEAFNFPTIINLTVVSTESDTSTTDIALEFKNETGASITGLNIDGYDVDMNMADGGDVTNVLIDGSEPDVNEGTTANTYTLNSGKSSTKVNISDWTWIRRSLD